MFRIRLPPPEYSDLKKTAWSLIFAVAVYTAIVLFSDTSRVVEAVSRISLYWIPLFLSLSLVNYTLRFFKWQYFLQRVGVHIPWKESMSVFVAGFSMTVSPGKLGELLKCYLLKERRDIPVSRTSPVVVAERVTDLISMIFIAMIGLLLVEHKGAMIAVGAGIVFVLAAMIFLLWKSAFSFLTNLLCRIKPVNKHRDSFEQFHTNCTALLDLRSMMISVPLGILSWGAEAMVLCLVAMSLGIEPGLSVGLALLAHSAGTIAGAVSMIPGGLGLTEITIGAILITAMPEVDAAVTTIIMRFATLWFAVLLGVIVLAIRKRANR
ncbi:MAG: flippase-like domain-containing protein [Candidatus Aegiribacteria sp.]|nr:flippase-like domain-containing protein [Candidatus Aegiribacteria sp.]